MTDGTHENPPTPGNRQALLGACLLDGQGGATPVTASEIPALPPASGALWLHLDYSVPTTMDILEAQESLPQQVVENLLADDARPRSDPIAQGLFVVLRGVNTNPGADPDDMVAVRVWIEPGRIITTRRRRLRSVQDIQAELEQQRGPTDPGSFLLRLVERLGLRASDVIENIEESIDALEARLDTDQHKMSGLRGELSKLRRETAMLRRHLAPQRDALERLTRETSILLSDSLRMDLRDEADRSRRYVEELDLARERAMVAYEQMLSLVAEQQNQRLFLLSVVAAIFLPLSFVTGLLGMNVGGIPGDGDPHAFGTLILVMLGLAAALLGLFRWRGWF